MKLLLIYDIVEDRIRNKIADICLDYGLERIQYSAFLGELNHNRQEAMLQKMNRGMARGERDLSVFPLCQGGLGPRGTIWIARTSTRAGVML